MTTTSTSLPAGSMLRAGRVLGGTELALGVLLSVRPASAAAAAAGRHGRPAPSWLVRILGLRSLTQAAITIAMPSETVLSAGALVDATHAASMAPFIMFSSRHRRAAAISACLAAASAAAGALATGHIAPTPPTMAAP